MRLPRFALLVLAFVPAALPAQFKFDLGEGRELTLTQAVQVWDVASFQMSAPDSIGKRNDLYLRRGRIGLEGKLSEKMAFNVALAYDGIGKDPYTPTAGSANSPDNKDVFIWDALWMWSFSPELNLTLGYFRPQAGKEHISSEFYVISFDKSLPDVQVRQHLLARSTGREMGANVGGLYLADGWSLNYNVGMFDPSNPAIIGNGSLWSPLLAGRLAFTLGDPEITQYKISYVQTYYGKRSGTTIGLNGARQGPTEVFNSNALYGVDILSNYGPFDFNAEYDWLYRGTRLPDGTINPTTDKVYSIKAGYRIPMSEDEAIEPAAMYTGERAVTNGTVPSRNASTGSISRDLYDVGLNWLLKNDKFKINLHYVWGNNFSKEPDPEFSYIGAGVQLVY